jgi:hypothetical protein
MRACDDIGCCPGLGVGMAAAMDEAELKACKAK